MPSQLEKQVTGSFLQVTITRSILEKYKDKADELNNQNEIQSNILDDLESQLENLTSNNLDEASLLNEQIKSKLENVYHIENPPDTQLIQLDSWESYYRLVLNDINSIKVNISQENKDKLIEELYSSMINTLAVTFGVDKMLFEDLDGGNVDTVHNVRNEIWVTGMEKNRFINREDYNTQEYHRDINYIKLNRDKKEQKTKGKLLDDYTGTKIATNGKYDQDHVVSAKEISDDPGRILAELDGPQIANVSSNLVATFPSINRGKGAKSMDEYINMWHKSRSERVKEISKLESKDSLSDKEKKKLNTLKKVEEFDEDLARELDRKARNEYNKTINKNYYTSKKFIKSTLNSSAKQGIKMGLREIFAIIFRDITSDIIKKIKELRKKKISLFSSEAFSQLKTQFLESSKRIMSDWDRILKQSFDVAASGFVSNIVTTIINIFATTMKKWVRVIREGSASIIKAFKLILTKSSDLTREERYHEASKIVITTISVSVGVVIDEALEKYFLTHSIPFSDLISSLISGIVTGVSSTMLVYGFDQLDIWGVNETKELESIFNNLEDIGNSFVV